MRSDLESKTPNVVQLTDVVSFLRKIEQECPGAAMFRGQTRDWPSYQVSDDIL